MANAKTTPRNDAPVSTESSAVEKDDSFYGAAASTKKGRECVLKVLEATRSALVSHGYGGLTLRLVAERAEMAHSNVQYYYPTKERLIDGYMAFQSDRYREDLGRILSERTDDPEGRLRAYVRYYIEDDRNTAVNTLFYEMRAMSQRNDAILHVLDALYEGYRHQVERLIADVNPVLAKPERALRAATIVSLIDGLMVFLGDRNKRYAELAGLAEEAEREIMRIALRPATPKAEPARSRRKVTA
jgi:AcrR family transcriptional regulator